MTERQELHAMVDQFAEAMKKKFDQQRLAGWQGWKEWFQFWQGGRRVCPEYEQELRERLEKQISKLLLDPVDIGNFAALLYAARKAKP